MGKQHVGVIGAGNWGLNHIKILTGLGCLGAVAELDKHRVEKVRMEYPGVKLLGNYSVLINNPSIEAVIIATPANTHYEIAKEALKSGKDVLIEKPMTLDFPEAEELVSLAKENKRILMVGHLLLYKPAVQNIIEIINSGELGKIYFIEMRRLKLGRVRREENVLWSFAPHDFAFLLYLVSSPVKKLLSYGLNTIQSQIEDDVRVNIEFENGINAHIHSSWMWPEDERKTFIICSKGMIVYDENLGMVRVYKRGVNSDLTIWDNGFEETFFEEKNALGIEIQHFLDCIKDRRKPITDGRKGAAVIEILTKASNQLCNNNFFHHQSAYLDQPTKVGKGTKIWHFTHIMDGVEIGENCNIGQNVFIAKNTKIGNNVKIQNNVSVFEGVVLEDDVFCGPSIVFTNVKIPRSAFPKSKSSEYLQTKVKQGATIGANSTIVCGVTVGKHAFIGAGAVVTKDVPEFAIVYGNPAKICGWLCRCGMVKVGKDEDILECSVCGTKLNMKDGKTN